MPEYPDVVVYVEHLRRRLIGRVLEKIRLGSPFVVRSADPPLRLVEGKRVVGVSRLGKRIILELEGDLFLVFHLMIAGRLHWVERGTKVPGRRGLAAFDFDDGTLSLTEASSKKRASLHLVRGRSQLTAFDRAAMRIS